MPRNIHTRSVAALLLAGSLLAAGCSDDLVGPSIESPQVQPRSTPSIDTLDPDVRIPRTQKHLGRDLAIVRVADEGSGQITVTVRNEGPSYFYGRFEVGLYREYGEHAAKVQTQGWGDAQTLLAPGATVILKIERTSCGGSMRYFVVVDPQNQIVESNEENNRSVTFFSWGCS
jgi:hypothetical protein